LFELVCFLTVAIVTLNCINDGLTCAALTKDNIGNHCICFCLQVLMSTENPSLLSPKPVASPVCPNDPGPRGAPVD